MSDDFIELALDEIEPLALRVLARHGFDQANAAAIARVLAAAQIDDCQSHGLYRLPGMIATCTQDAADPGAEPRVSRPAGASVRVDARRGFSPLAFERGLPALVDAAHRQGVAVMAVNHCYHYTALWPEVEAIAGHGLAALAMTPSHPWVAPHGGGDGLLGTNPLAFAWPRGDDFPYVFDFATSAMARGDIELHARAGRALPPGVAVDADGHPTTDAKAALDGAMLPFGAHKGSALATMVELMAGPLIGDLTSVQSAAAATRPGLAPYHGEILVAFDAAHLAGDARADGERGAQALFGAFADQHARLPSQRRRAARARAHDSGRVPVARSVYAELEELL